MHFTSLDAVLNMAGHGVFVWSAYAVTTLVIVAMVWMPLRRKKRLMKELAGAERQQVQVDARPERA
ncbi:MAG: heme exporter protein CcmD [Pseudomonadota bacterium]